MKIFLDEPLIDWQMHADRQSKIRGIATGSAVDETQQSAQQHDQSFAEMQMQVVNSKLGMHDCAEPLVCMLARAC